MQLPYQINSLPGQVANMQCQCNTHYKKNWRANAIVIQIRPLCGYYTRVNTPLEGEKYWRECCTYQIIAYLTRLIAYLAMLGY